MDRESKSADEIAALINESVRDVSDLHDVAVVVIRLLRPDANGCNWVARQINRALRPSPQSLHLVNEIVSHAKRYFNLFEVH